MSLINDKHDCRRLKLAIIATHPIQYQVPLWRILSTHPSLDLEVFYGTDMSVRGYCDAEFGRDVRWDVPLTTGYRHTFLSTDPTINEVTPFQPWAWHLWRHLRRFRPDVALLNAYGAIFWIQSAAMLRLLRIPIILRHEASDEAVARGTSKACVRDLFLRAFYSQVATFAVIGKSAREHLGRLGVKSRKMISAPYHVDSTLMTNLAATWLPRRHVLRTEMGVLPMDCVLIFSGKLIPKKNPLIIVEALRLLPKAAQQRFHLLILGDGILRSALEQTGRELLGPRLHCVGFINQQDLGRWYAAADILVLPSHSGHGETWGLVVNEAFHFGLPAIVSDGVGCQPDLVSDNSSGRVFRSGNVDSLSRAVLDLSAELPAARDGYAAAVVDKISRFTTYLAADGITTAAALATGIPISPFP